MSSYERCFDAAFKALEHLNSVRYMWNGPIHKAAALLLEATGPQPDKSSASSETGAISDETRRRAEATMRVLADDEACMKADKAFWRGRARFFAENILRAAPSLEKRYEDALRHIAMNGVAHKDWKIAQLVLDGKTVDEAKDEAIT